MDEHSKNSQATAEGVLRFIDANYHRHIAPRDVAAAMCYSPHHLARVTRTMYGFSVRDLLLKRRMGAALDLLAHTTLPVADVAARVGFNDMAHFSRRFSAMMGSSPSQWRERQQATESVQAKRFCFSCGREY
jgi:AraC-like DNA-binding protein